MPSELDNYLAVLTGRGRARGFLEVRYRFTGGMRSRFYRHDRLPRLQDLVVAQAKRCDVYIGCAIRDRERGDRDSIRESWVLWAELDGKDSLDAVRRFELAPTLLVASGTPGHLHAYWSLKTPVEPDVLEDANQRLAFALNADRACCDAARILRPPATRNFKHKPARGVHQVDEVGAGRYALSDVLDGLPEVPTVAPHNIDRRSLGDDEILCIPPSDYVPLLTGLRPGLDGKISCPFHEDRTPSFHVYPTPERGWYCFGCGRGGSIYDLASAVWLTGQKSSGVGKLRGREFVEVRERLMALFLDG